MKVRRDPKLRERLTPCGCCKHPISQRHHLIPIAEAGENGSEYPLCANCHELFHIIDRGFTALQRDPKSNDRSVRTWEAVVAAWGNDHPTLLFLYDLVNHSRNVRNAKREARDVALQVFSLLVGDE